MTDRRIKILHVLDSLAVGGMERVVIDVANGLERARFEQTVCCISRRGEAARHLREDVMCLDLGKGAQADRLMPLKLARLIRTQQPDIVHTQSWSGIDAALAHGLTRRARLIHSEHGRNLPHIYGEPLGRKIARRCLYQVAAAVFAISQEVRDYYCRETGFARERMQIIPNGIDVRRIDEANVRGVREELGLRPQDFVIGTIARLDATKDTATLVQAFAQLRLADVKLLIVGDGSERRALETLVTTLGVQSSVVFTGLRHDVPRLLGAMNVFALSSLSEGLPITALEAMAASLPIVATHVGALPELVAEGETGFLVAPKQFQAMAEKLAWLFEHPASAKAFGTAARRKVERDYSLDLMLQRYAALYEWVLK